jgi:hypothetical protein
VDAKDYEIETRKVAREGQRLYGKLQCYQALQTAGKFLGAACFNQEQTSKFCDPGKDLII